MFELRLLRLMDHSSLITGFTSWPSPSISLTITSPGFRYSGGLRYMPTPPGVPVKMTSPGRRVMPLKEGEGSESWRFTTSYHPLLADPVDQIIDTEHQLIRIANLLLDSVHAALDGQLVGIGHLGFGHDSRS